MSKIVQVGGAWRHPAKQLGIQINGVAGIIQLIFLVCEIPRASYVRRKLLDQIAYLARFDSGDTGSVVSVFGAEQEQGHPWLVIRGGGGESSFPRNCRARQYDVRQGTLEIARSPFRRIDTIYVRGIQRKSRTANDKVIIHRRERGRRNGAAV